MKLPHFQIKHKMKYLFTPKSAKHIVLDNTLHH